ncbi:MAG: hypothetical protein CVT59_11185 [Actinobacteria bacterium HGW-Actinobacteria-1]|jgi:sigma-E factor negative regulatory protein RseC|nr:MAG: hypothetical protein CVT59_11185 [Actinobacteria bacterium HGW-Actinobacteria-1]
MIEHGTVVAVRGTNVDVVLAGSSACQGCSACSASDSGELLLRDVVDRAGANLGDEVEVLIPEGLRMKAALAVYGVPLASLLLGYLAGFLLGSRLGMEPDVAGAVLGVLAASAALAGTRFAERVVMRGGRFSPRVHAILSRGSGRNDVVPENDDL